MHSNTCRNVNLLNVYVKQHILEVMKNAQTFVSFLRVHNEWGQDSHNLSRVTIINCWRGTIVRRIPFMGHKQRCQSKLTDKFLESNYYLKNVVTCTCNYMYTTKYVHHQHLHFHGHFTGPMANLGQPVAHRFSSFICYKTSGNKWHSFLQAKCLSCRPTNTAKALKRASRRLTSLTTHNTCRSFSGWPIPGDQLYWYWQHKIKITQK